MMPHNCISLIGKHLSSLSLLSITAAIILIAKTSSPPLPGDLLALQSLQSLGGGWHQNAARLLSIPGSPFWAIASLASLTILTVAFRKPGLTTVSALALLTLGFARLLKSFIERPRPSPALVAVLTHADTYSFPSGHTVHATLFLSILMALLWAFPLPKWISITLTVSATLFIIGTGLSRIYLGAHWPSDILGSCLLSLLALKGSFSAHNQFNQWISSLLRRTRLMID